MGYGKMKKNFVTILRGFVELTVAGLSVLAFLMVISVTRAESAEQDSAVYMKNFSLEDLLNLEVTSVSKKKEKILNAPAAVFVISSEDIRRSGVTSIPDALRMVPGVQVAKVDSSKWAISARGFNGRFANKLLVLMDGRSLYTPFYSGVFWDVQDTMLEDIDRIEIIRGPGAALWGANAVNGVINIITKNAKDTRGGLITAGAGTYERGFVGARAGGAIDENTAYRVYAKYFNRDNGVNAGGHNMEDDWNSIRGGFRIDRNGDEGNSVTLQGDIYNGDAGQTITITELSPPFAETLDEDVDVSGGNILCRWTKRLPDDAEFMLQFYYDRTDHKEKISDIQHDIIDTEVQYRFQAGSRHDFTTGAGYRFIHDDIDGSFFSFVEPSGQDDEIFSFFIQDTITLVPERLSFTLGTKYEHNDYTGSEIQPNFRMMWTPASNHSIWASVSRSVRTPSRVEHDGNLVLAVVPGIPPNVINLTGDNDYDSEELIAFELGYRFIPVRTFSVDISAFYNDYDKLASVRYETPVLTPVPAPAHLVTAVTVGNKKDGETYGIEVAADWIVNEIWRIKAAYSFLKIQMHQNGGGSSLKNGEGTSPHNQFSVRSSLDLPFNLEFDLWGRYVDNLPDQGVKKYLTLDARLGCRLNKNLEISIVGQNLLDSRHSEFSLPELISNESTEVEQSVYCKLEWHF